MDRTPHFIFDVDNTFIDTHDCFLRANIRACQMADVRLTEELMWDGQKTPEGFTLASWLALQGAKQEKIERIMHDRFKEYQKALATDTKWIPGAPEVLAEVQQSQGSIVAVTNSIKEWVRISMNHLNAWCYIDTILTADTEGILPKPHKSGLQHAAQLADKDVSECIYVGDQYGDAMAAHNAGMRSIIIATHHTPPIALEKATHTIPHFQNLFEWEASHAASQ